ncbi:MAG: DUF4198 domain-containing protein [Pseudomonadota bacterium]
MLRNLITLSLLTLSTAASAHSFWLQPRDFSLESDEPVVVDFKVGDAGDVNDWGLYWERIAALRLHGPDAVIDQQNAVRTTGPGEAGSALVSAKGEGTHVLVFESNPSFSDLEADRFQRYLAHEGLKAIADHRAAAGTESEPGTELYARRAKALIQVGGMPTANVTKPIGQTLEIVPLDHPLLLDPGQTLRVRVLWRGQPLGGATVVSASTDGSGETTTRKTNLDGIVALPVSRSGGTLISTVWGVPAPNDQRADYFTIFASLTFGST